MVSSRSLKLLVILGPTASGKSAWGLKLAQLFGGEIINADSRQFYQEMHIGTAKPTKAEMSDVPHHLIDCTTLNQPWDVAQFVKNAADVIAKISSRGKLPILVGGTGLYIRSLIYGMDAIPPIPESLRDRLKQDLETQGLPKLYAQLQTLDLVSAERLQPNDSQRILRALEVVLHTKKPIHEFWQNQTEPNYETLRLGLSWPRDQLYQRIDERVDVMFNLGLKNEVKNLVAQFPNNAVLSKTIGYQEWLLHGFDAENLVKQEIQKHSRNFAKRQLTWFNKESDIWWGNPQDFDAAKQKVFNFLNDNV